MSVYTIMLKHAVLWLLLCCNRSHLNLIFFVCVCVCPLLTWLVRLSFLFFFFSFEAGCFFSQLCSGVTAAGRTLCFAPAV